MENESSLDSLEGGGGEREITGVHLVFCRKFNSQQFFFEEFFDIINILSCVEPKSESTFPIQYNI